MLNIVLRGCYLKFTSFMVATLNSIPYYVKFSRHIYFASFLDLCAYFATLEFRDFAKILYFESLSFSVFQ